MVTPDREYNYPRDHLSINSREQMKLPPPARHHQHHQPQPVLSTTNSSNISERRPQNLPPPVSCAHILPHLVPEQGLMMRHDKQQIGFINPPKE